MVEIQVNSKIKKYKLNLLCYVLPTVVSELPPCTAPKEGWNIPYDLRCELADPSFNVADSVDLLIGAGIFYDLLEVEQISLDVGSLSLQNTKFGWIVTSELGATCLLSMSSLGESIEND